MLGEKSIVSVSVEDRWVKEEASRLGEMEFFASCLRTVMSWASTEGSTQALLHRG